MLASDCESSAMLYQAAPVNSVLTNQSPTDFWLDTYTIAQVFDNPNLISSLASYSEQLPEPQLTSSFSKQGMQGEVQSTLFLRVQAAASYYSTNRSLMEYPSPVDVDISRSPDHATTAYS